MRKLKDAIRYQQIRDAGFTDGEISFFDLMAKSESEICAFMPIHFFQTQLLDRLNGAGKEVLADKLKAQQFFSLLGIQTPELIGVWHPVHGVTKAGNPMTTATQLPRKRALPGQSKLSWAFYVLREKVDY